MFWQNEVLSPSDHEAADYRALMILLNGRQTNYYCNPEAPPPIPVWRPGAHVEYLRGLRMSGGGSYDFDFAAGVEGFPTRVLFLAGECSALGPDYQQRHHVPLFHDADLVSIANAGHRLFVEDFDAVLAAMRAYLAAYTSD